MEMVRRDEKERSACLQDSRVWVSLCAAIVPVLYIDEGANWWSVLARGILCLAAFLASGH